MAEGKRKPGDDAEEMEDADKGKKTKFADKEFCPTLAETISDADAITRLVNKNLRRPEDAASSSTGQQRG